jgi:hypothetical protein
MNHIHLQTLKLAWGVGNMFQHRQVVAELGGQRGGPGPNIKFSPSHLLALEKNIKKINGTVQGMSAQP